MTSTMGPITHDVLCINRLLMAGIPEHVECGSCSFIAKIRTDEQRRITTTLVDWLLDNGHMAARAAYARALMKAVEAVKETLAAHSAPPETNRVVEEILGAIESIGGERW